LRKAKLSGRKDQTPTRHDSIRLIDDDQKHEAELFDAHLELGEMAGTVLAGGSSERPQAVDIDQFWAKIARNRIAVAAQHWMLCQGLLHQRARRVSRRARKQQYDSGFPDARSPQIKSRSGGISPAEQFADYRGIEGRPRPLPNTPLYATSKMR